MTAEGIAGLSAFRRVDAQIATRTAAGAAGSMSASVDRENTENASIVHERNTNILMIEFVFPLAEFELTLLHVLRSHAVWRVFGDFAILFGNVDVCASWDGRGALSLDTLDLSGTRETDTRFAKHMDIHKLRLDPSGKRIKIKGKNAEYQAPVSIEDFAFGHTQSLNLEGTAEHIKHIDEEMGRHEGCNIFGFVDSQRVAGNFHLSVHLPNFMMMAETPPDLSDVNVAHTIHQLSFGPQFPGQVNPLDGLSHVNDQWTGTYKYFLKVVPTEYKRRDGVVLKTNQFSVAEYFVPNSPERRLIPAVHFMYDISPIVVAISEKRRSLPHFVVRLCAVVGGVFATTGLVDRVVAIALRSIGKKSDISLKL
ncbi:hypothetical protein BSKO_10845 [Bryopsis sp. KO-2023]|nr:hypothetical protein BSKO_10845 [Bryopsis sp. KO-2023]